MSDAAWVPIYKCHWCGGPFVKEAMDGANPWVCSTPACRDRQVAWKMLDVRGKLLHLPTPKQVTLEEAIQSRRFTNICIGGGRGSAKSHGLRMIAYRCCRTLPNFKALMLRRTYVELAENHIEATIGEQDRLGAKYSAYRLRFDQTGSVMRYGHCHEDKDWAPYVGAEFDLVIFDQIEMFADQQVSEISASAGRRVREDWSGLVLAGENPGGPLSPLVDETYISKSRSRDKYPDYDPDLYHYIDAQLEDNPYVSPRYVQFLAGLAPEKRAMYRWGRRDVFPGQYFRDKLCVQAMTIPNDVPRQGAMRWGFMAPGIFLWLVVLPDNRIYVEREWVFEQTLAKDVALTVRAMTALLGQTLHSVQGNRGIKDAEGGEDIFETLARHELFVQPSAHDPVMGWQRLRHWLRQLDNGQSALIVHPQCETLIRTLPQLIASKLDPEDVDDASPSTAAKALRYFVMSRPMPLQTQAEKAYPVGSAGELMQQVISGQSSSVVGRHNVSR